MDQKKGKQSLRAPQTKSPLECCHTPQYNGPVFGTVLHCQQQQLAWKLRGRHPVKQFASVSPTCPVCELALQIIPQWIVASGVRLKTLCCANRDWSFFSWQGLSWQDPSRLGRQAESSPANHISSKGFLCTNLKWKYPCKRYYRCVQYFCPSKLFCYHANLYGETIAHYK